MPTGSYKRKPENNLKMSKKMKGRVFTDEHKKHLRENHARGMKGKHHTEKAKLLISKANSGSRNFFYGKKHTEETLEKLRNRVVSEKTKAKIREARLKQRMPKKDTKIEILMRGELKKQGIQFREQVPLGGVAIVDFFIPKYNVSIQCDGEYWHKLPKRKLADIRQNKILRKQGYKVFRFWGEEIKESASSCVNSLQL